MTLNRPVIIFWFRPQTVSPCGKRQFFFFLLPKSLSDKWGVYLRRHKSKILVFAHIMKTKRLLLIRLTEGLIQQHFTSILFPNRHNHHFCLPLTFSIIIFFDYYWHWHDERAYIRI